MKNAIIYVLCYNDNSERQAIDEFSSYEWARIYRIKDQCVLQEGVMYRNELMDLYDEWKDKDYVGTIAYSIFSKVSRDHFFNLLKRADPNYYDVVFFGCIGYGGLFEYHSLYVENVFNSVMKIFRPPQILKFGIIPPPERTIFAYWNYFMTTPKYMLQYVSFYKNKWLPLLESHPNVWQDSKYPHGKLNAAQLLKLTTKPYYPCHTFVSERMIYTYFKHTKCRILSSQPS
jgi:hypothetical protein